MNIKTLTLALFASALSLSPALADKSPIDAAWKAAMMDFEGALTDEQHTTVNRIAYHAAAARLCDGLELNVEEVGKQMDGLADIPGDDADDAHRMERLTNILVTLGTVKGLILAEGSLDKDKFCTAAMAAKAEEGSGHLWK